MNQEGLPPGFSRETKIRRDQRGRWYDGQDLIEHPNLIRNFDRWIDLAEDGRYCLRNEINWAYVSIEGPPYFVRSVIVQDEAILLCLSGDIHESLVPSTLSQAANGSLWCKVRSQRLPAQLSNHAAMQLENFLIEEDNKIYFIFNQLRYQIDQLT